MCTHSLYSRIIVDTLQTASFKLKAFELRLLILHPADNHTRHVHRRDGGRHIAIGDLEALQLRTTRRMNGLIKLFRGKHQMQHLEEIRVIREPHATEVQVPQVYAAHERQPQFVLVEQVAADDEPLEPETVVKQEQVRPDVEDVCGHCGERISFVRRVGVLTTECQVPQTWAAQAVEEISRRSRALFLHRDREQHAQLSEAREVDGESRLGGYGVMVMTPVQALANGDGETPEPGRAPEDVVPARNQGAVAAPDEIEAEMTKVGENQPLSDAELYASRNKALSYHSAARGKIDSPGLAGVADGRVGNI